MKKCTKLLAGVILLMSLVFSPFGVSAQSIDYERVTWDELNNENFDVNSITQEDFQKANEIADQSLDSLFKKDNEGYAVMDISTIENEYGTEVANVFKVGLANVNLDIEYGVTQFAPDNKSFIKGPNYDDYVTENEDSESTVSLLACTWQGGTKAILGAGAGGAVVGGALSGGAAAIPGGITGGMTGGIGYYATCWW